MRANAARGYALAGLASMFWAGTAPGIKFLLESGVPRLSIALWRDVFVAIGLLGALFVFRRSTLKTDLRTLLVLAPAGAITIGMYHLLWVVSVGLNGAALAVVLVYVYPAFVTLGARLVFREPITRAQALALAVAFVGCALAVKAYDPAVWQVSWLGIAVGLGSAVLQTGYTMYNQHSARRMDGWATLSYLMLFGAVALFVLTLVTAPADILAVPDAGSWLWLIGLAIGPTLGGYGLFNMSLRYIPGKTAGLISVTEVLFAAVIAYFAFGETLEPIQIVGVALVLVATVLPNIGASNAADAFKEETA